MSKPANRAGLFGRAKWPVHDAGWSSPVAREAHNLEVPGSNPGPATCSKSRRIPELRPDFGPLALKAGQRRLIDAGHSRKYISKLVAIIPRMFKWAASEQLLPGAIYHEPRTVEGLRKGRCEAPDHPPVLPFPAAIVEATLPCLPPVAADIAGTPSGATCTVKIQAEILDLVDELSGTMHYRVVSSESSIARRRWPRSIKRLKLRLTAL